MRIPLFAVVCPDLQKARHPVLDSAGVVRDVERAIKMGKALIVVAKISETHRLDFDKRC